jgi:glycosyltransferase involved in cell wall biosynthesis
MKDINKKKIAVLIPCYNEAKTISKVVNDYKKVLPEADIYVYDNNSTDGTDKLAKKAGAIVRYEYRQGKGNVIRTMFREINADCYLMIDGDDTYPSENAREMCDLILLQKADMVIGDRLSSTYFAENKRPFHNFGNRIVRLLINRLFHNNIKDIMTGYRAFSYDFIKGFPVLSKNFEIETEMTIHAVDKNYKIKEIPVTYRDRPQGSVSKLNTYSDGIKVLKTIATLFKEYKPMGFFSLISLLLVLTSLIFLIPSFTLYFKTGLVDKLPSLIVGAFIILTAILSLMCGIILQVIVKKDRQQYELLMNEMKMIVQKDNKEDV